MDIVTVDIHMTEGLIHTFLLLQAGKINWPNIALPPSWIYHEVFLINVIQYTSILQI